MSAENSKKTGVGVILLAAGKSSRLGRPKQLLPYHGRTFVQHSLQVAGGSDAKTVVVVLGAHAGLIRKEIEGPGLHIVENAAWQEGMAASIRCGIAAFTRINPDAAGIILMVCDQPFVTPQLLNRLIAAHHETGKPIVACSYEGTYGPPVFFHHSFFDELLQLKGDVGARGIVRQHTGAVAMIPFPEGTVDVDTEADYESIQPGSRQ